MYTYTRSPSLVSGLFIETLSSDPPGTSRKAPHVSAFLSLIVQEMALRAGLRRVSLVSPTASHARYFTALGFRKDTVNVHSTADLFKDTVNVHSTADLFKDTVHVHSTPDLFKDTVHVHSTPDLLPKGVHFMTMTDAQLNTTLDLFARSADGVRKLIAQIDRVQFDI